MLSRIWHILTRPRGNRSVDFFLRGTGLIAAIGIPFALYLPASIPLIWLVVVGLFLTGPLGPFFPTGFEPLVMEAAKYQHPFLVGLVATAVFVYVEILNWQVWRWMLARQALTRLREKRWMQRYVDLFARHPFAAVVFAAATPFPFWAVRILAIYNEYGFKRYLLAVAVGRFPRNLFYAWIGDTFQPPTELLVGIALGSAVLVLLWRVSRRKRPQHAAVTAPESAGATHTVAPGP